MSFWRPYALDGERCCVPGAVFRHLAMWVSSGSAFFVLELCHAPLVEAVCVSGCGSGGVRTRDQGLKRRRKCEIVKVRLWDARISAL